MERRSLLWLGFLAAACSAGVMLPEPAAGPPAPPPDAVSDDLAFLDGQAVDSDEGVGLCVTLHLWAETNHGQDWVVVAVNDILLDGEGRDARGRERFCELPLLPGPKTYNLPMHEVPSGWYTICNLSSECSPSFEYRS